MKPGLIFKILNVLSVAAALSAAPAVADSGLKKFHMRSCLADGMSCLEITSLKMDQSSLGGLWVSLSADVRLSSAKGVQSWQNKRVVIDSKQGQVTIEERTTQKLFETVIALKDFKILKQETNL